MDLELPFTHRPGRRERQLQRRHLNPLFAWPPQAVPPEDLFAAQRADHEDMEAFADAFGIALQQAVDLPPEADSETLLGLKERLEVLYEQSHALPEDHAEARGALRRLIELIMQTVRRYAGNDPVARQELSDEEAARAIHFRLLEQPLVADLLHPDSLIGPEELTPTLLGASAAEVAAASELFDGAQLDAILRRGEALLGELAAVGSALGQDLDPIAARLELLRQRREQFDIATGGH